MQLVDAGGSERLCSPSTQGAQGLLQGSGGEGPCDHPPCAPLPAAALASPEGIALPRGGCCVSHLQGIAVAWEKLKQQMRANVPQEMGTNCQ